MAGFVGGAAAAKGLITAFERMAIREVGAAAASSKIITIGVSTRLLGEMGEAAVNLSKGLTEPMSRTLTRFVVNGRTRYADGVKRDQYDNIIEMWEVKNVKDLSDYLPQLKDYTDYIAKMKRDKNIDVEFELYIRGPSFDVPTKIDDPAVVKFLNDNEIVPILLDDLVFNLIV